MGTTSIIRRYRFCAAHRLHTEHLSAEENRTVFGKCNNPNGHGHNYVVLVTIACADGAGTGRGVSLDELDRIVADRIITRFDHHDLNLDPEFVSKTTDCCLRIRQLPYTQMLGVIQIHTHYISGLEYIARSLRQITDDIGINIAPSPGHAFPIQIHQLSTAHIDTHALFFFADGFNGDADQLCSALPSGLILAGGLSSGDLHTGHSYQLAGPQTGNGALTAALLRGDLRVGVGAAHGWKPVGSQFRVTRSRGFWLRTLDGRPASETYAQLFGYPAGINAASVAPSGAAL